MHDGGFRLIVNFSIDDRTDDTTHRVIALVHNEEWKGAVEKFEPTGCAMRSGRVAAHFGTCEFALADGAYELTIRLPTIRLHAQLRLVPVSTPFVVNNQPLASGARLSWLFVPRLEAHGHVWIGDTQVGLRGAPAYHDHNWGRFRWGDNFGWEWGSVLPRDRSDPWSIVCMRMTDRNVGARHDRRCTPGTKTNRSRSGATPR